MGVEAAIRQWMARHCAHAANVLHGAVVLAGSKGPQVVARYPVDTPTPPWVLEICSMSTQRGGRLSLMRHAPDGTACHAVGMPLMVQERVVGTCVVVCRGQKPTPAELEALSLSVAQFPINAPSKAQTQPANRLASTVLAVLKKAALQQTLEDAAGAVAITLAHDLGCDRVAIGLFAERNLRLVASSDGSHTTSSELTADTISAMEEALDDQGSFVYPVAPEATRLDAAHARLCNRVDLLAACTVPLSFKKESLGAVIATRQRSQPFSPEETALIEAVAAVVGPWFALRRQADESWLRRLAASTTKLWNKTGQGRYRLLAAVTLAVAAVVLGWPAHRQIVTPVKLEGAIQRVIAAPGDNYIRKVAVRPGDAVKAGDVLLEFDVEDLRVERQRLLAAQAFNDAAAGDAMSKNDSATLAQYQAKLEEGKAQLALLDQRLQRGTIVAPFDAVVIEGDLSNALGAPTKKGEKLMILAPAREFRAIVEIADSDITNVNEGQAGEMVLTALPDATMPIRLKRIIPLATVNDGRTYFEGEVELVGAQAALQALRPGMRGIARLEGGQQARGIVWFEEARNWCRFAWWRWVG